DQEIRHLPVRPIALAKQLQMGLSENQSIIETARQQQSNPNQEKQGNAKRQHYPPEHGGHDARLIAKEKNRRRGNGKYCNSTMPICLDGANESDHFAVQGFKRSRTLFVHRKKVSPRR